MHSLDDIEISLRLSFEKAGIILTVKYHAKSSVFNLSKYLTTHKQTTKTNKKKKKKKIDCNYRPW